MNILKLFFDDPARRYNVREVARLVKIAPATASKALKELRDEGIVAEQIVKNLYLYKASVRNDKYRDMKIFYNIRTIKESGLIESMVSYYPKATIVLFGSMSTGYDYKDSDIDMVVISDDPMDFPEEKKFSKKLGRELHIFPVRGLEDLNNPHLINNVIDGTLIRGEFDWISTNAKIGGLSKEKSASDAP